MKSSLRIYFHLYDADKFVTHKADHITSFLIDNITLNVFPAKNACDLFPGEFDYSNNSPRSFEDSIETGGSVHFRFAVKAHCLDNFYGSDCKSKCIPKHLNASQHFGCAVHTGNKVCLPGRYRIDDLSTVLDRQYFLDHEMGGHFERLE